MINLIKLWYWMVESLHSLFIYFCKIIYSTLVGCYLVWVTFELAAISVHSNSVSKNLGILKRMAQAVIQNTYFVTFIRRNFALPINCRWIIGRMIASYLSWAIPIVINIDAVKQMALNGYKNLGNIIVRIVVPKSNSMWNLISRFDNKKMVSKTNKLRSKWLKIFCIETRVVRT